MLAPLSLTPEIRGMNAVGEEHWRKWRVLNAHKCVLLGKESGLREVYTFRLVHLCIYTLFMQAHVYTTVNRSQYVTDMH